MTPKPFHADAGLATLHVRPFGKKLRQLARKGTVKIRVVAAYTPLYGDLNKQPITVKIKKGSKRA